MKVLLTGASGFVGSHVLDALRGQDIAARLLLRPTSDRQFIRSHLDAVELVEGSVDDPASLDRALAGVTHVIHCAGATKALRRRDFFRVNQTGTRNLVDAVNRHGHIERVVHISSLAAAGPSTPLAPLSERAPSQPVSTYGRSKLAAEEEVASHCEAPFTILRPSAVYGPRDREFLRLFKAVRLGIKPVFGNGTQEFSFVFVEDLAGAAVHCLTSPAAVRRTFFVADRSIFTGRQLNDKIAEVMKRSAILIRVPGLVLYGLCGVQEAISQLTRKASVLSLQKIPELRVPAWTCDASRLQIETGYVCTTGMTDGLTATFKWYRQQRWL